MPALSKSAGIVDPHKQKVYAWEQSWHAWNWNTISLAACRKAIRRACTWYKVDPPTVVQHKGRSYSWPEQNRISMQTGERAKVGGKNMATAMHEAAHHIAHALHGERIQDHGPVFLAIYIDLLERAQVAPRTALEASARAFGLKWRSYPTS